MKKPVFDDSQSPVSPFAKLAAVALIVFHVALQPFAAWHGALDTDSAASTYAVSAAGREGWYFLHYGTVLCLSGIAISLVGVLAWFSAHKARNWSIAATILVLLSAVHMAIGFGAEAIGYYFATDPSVMTQGVATGYIQAWMDGGHYVLPVVTGMFAYYLGSAAAVRAFYRLQEFPLWLRRLLILAVVIDFAKLSVPYLVGILFSFAAAAVWVAFGIAALQRLSRPTPASPGEVLLPST